MTPESPAAPKQTGPAAAVADLILSSHTLNARQSQHLFEYCETVYPEPRASPFFTLILHNGACIRMPAILTGPLPRSGLCGHHHGSIRRPPRVRSDRRRNHSANLARLSRPELAAAGRQRTSEKHPALAG